MIKNVSKKSFSSLNQEGRNMDSRDPNQEELTLQGGGGGGEGKMQTQLN